MRFFTSDQHWFHTRIIKYCDRPFEDFQEMNNTMMKNWNATVDEDDTVYVLGDWIFADNPQKMYHINHKLNGNKILILGNHDRFKPFDYVEYGFQSVHTYLEIELANGETVNLIHDPAPATSSTKVNPNRWLCGHVHTLFKSVDAGRVINIGVDVRGFAPVSEQFIIDYKN